MIQVYNDRQLRVKEMADEPCTGTATEEEGTDAHHNTRDPEIARMLNKPHGHEEYRRTKEHGMTCKGSSSGHRRDMVVQSGLGGWDFNFFADYITYRTICTNTRRVHTKWQAGPHTKGQAGPHTKWQEEQAEQESRTKGPHRLWVQ